MIDLSLPLPPVNPAKLVGPEVGTLCVLASKYSRHDGLVVEVLERSYVWGPHDTSYHGGARRYDWSVIRFGPASTMVVDDKDLTPLAVGTRVR
jgi:hypothetical protein